MILNAISPLLPSCWGFSFAPGRGVSFLVGSNILLLREGDGTPLQYSCLENPRDGGAWWAAICGVAQSRTRLKRLSSSSSNILLSMVVQQRVVILEFLQEKMSARPSTPSSCYQKLFHQAMKHLGLYLSAFSLVTMDELFSLTFKANPLICVLDSNPFSLFTGFAPTVIPSLFCTINFFHYTNML